VAATIAGAIRKLVLTPSPTEVTFAERGFDLGTPGRETLETSALHFVIGFEIAIEQRDEDAVVTRLEALERQFHGFAYEGAAMAYTLRDLLSPRPGNRQTERFLSGWAADHIFMAYIGIGFALARLPQRMWRRALPDQMALPDHPSLNWLIIDGYGFHQAFFEPDTWIRRRRPGALPWAGPQDYVDRVFDQGVGRALWFVHGGDVQALAATITGFPESRRSDLWCGAGLAAAYAGGVGRDSLEDLVKASVDYRAEVAQGAVFAIKARVLADIVTEHTELASRVICDLHPEGAAALATKSVVDLPEDADVPPYEVFRQRVQSYFR
jgi:hypothetical protein